MLTALGQEQKFEVKFLEIDEKTADGEAQCLAQLSTLPVAVCYGVGPDQVRITVFISKAELRFLYQKHLIKKYSNGGERFVFSQEFSTLFLSTMYRYFDSFNFGKKQTKISGTCFFGSIMLSLKTLTPHPMAPPPRKGNQQIATLVSLLKILLNP